MNSSIYECTVWHHRLKPKDHEFTHRLLMFYLDLDELDDLTKKLRLFGRNCLRPYNFKDSDHEPGRGGDLKSRLVSHLRCIGMDIDESCRVGLLTLPRMCGYVFNPISIFYLFDKSGQPKGVVAEVCNTFREIKLYVLGPETLKEDGVYRCQIAKFFYISPFSDLKMNLDFNMGLPGDSLLVQIDEVEQGHTVLRSRLAGVKKPLNDASLIAQTIRNPFMPMRVIIWIHYQALRLWIKGVPYHRKADNPEWQRQVLRPYSSMANKHSR